MDLESVYREVWGRGEDPRLTFLAVFCDTDDTGGTSEACVRHGADGEAGGVGLTIAIAS